MGTPDTITLTQTGNMYAVLHPDGSATIDWPSVRRIAAEVAQKRAATSHPDLEMHECIAALLWAANQPGVKP